MLRMLPTRWYPRQEKVWEDTADGQGFKAEIWEDHGLVEVFTYKGGQHGPAFASLQMWISPYLYRVRLPRHYHHRWVRRLASEFDWACHQRATASR